MLVRILHITKIRLLLCSHFDVTLTTNLKRKERLLEKVYKKIKLEKPLYLFTKSVSKYFSIFSAISGLFKRICVPA